MVGSDGRAGVIGSAGLFIEGLAGAGIDGLAGSAGVDGVDGGGVSGGEGVAGVSGIGGGDVGLSGGAGMPGDGVVGDSPGCGAPGTSGGVPGISGIVVCADNSAGDAIITSGSAADFIIMLTLISFSPRILGGEKRQRPAITQVPSRSSAHRELFASGDGAEIAAKRATG